MRTRYVGVLIACVCVAACGMQRARIASEAPTLLVGLPQDQVLGCMGPPASKAVQGTTEVWSYPSKDGEVQTMTSTGQGWASGKSAPAQQAYCTVNIAMAAGRVSKVSYVGPDGEALAPTARCTFALQSCIQ